MSENLKAFYQKLSEDEGLAAEFKALSEKMLNDRIAATIDFAKAHGIELTEADFAKPAEGTLSDDDLGLVTGGMGMYDSWDDPEPPFGNNDGWNFR